MSSGSHDSLADALRGMSGDAPTHRDARPSEPEYEAEFEAEVDGEMDGEVDDESGEIVAAAPTHAEPTYTRAGSSRSASSRKPVRRKSNNAGLKQAFAPVLITVGALLLIPAFWSIMLLTGITVSDRSDAKSMALIMLVCWPIALSLIGGGIWFYVQAKNEKKR